MRIKPIHIAPGIKHRPILDIRPQLRRRADAPQQNPLIPDQQTRDLALTALDPRSKQTKNIPDRVVQLRMRIMIIDQTRDQIDRVHRRVIPA